MKNARYIAYKALMTVETDGAYSNLALNETLNNSLLDRRDKAFVSTLFYGVLERRLTLDFIIRKFSSVRLKKIETPVLMILRLSVYQLVFMDKIPDSAAVNEAVSLCKREGYYRSSGFVNGLLRSIVRSENRFLLPDERDTVKYLSVRYSCPEKIVSLWLSDYGREAAEGILGSISGRPPIFIRANTLKITEDELIDRLSEEKITVRKTLLKNALELENTGSIAELNAYKEGLFYVQDLASQICCEILAPIDGDIVSDVCAAPGGKSLNTAQRVGSGKVFSYDIYEHKLKLINASAKRMGIDNISTGVRNAAEDIPIVMSDRILCDVPCSGLGVMRRKPEIRYKDDPGVESLPELQFKILENSARYVKPGGLLVYSTCTLNKAENNLNAERFLREHTDFEPFSLALPEGITRTIEEPDFCLTLFPHTNGTDGFFISAFLRK